MRGDSLSFFKPSVFVKAFLVSCVVFSSAFFSSCKDLAGFDPNVNGGRTVASNTFSAPTGLTATNGYKQKISLAWNPVSGAKYYEIWCASSNTSSDDEWKIVQVTDKIQYDDKVSAGRTLYYRVRAVKATGVTSRYSGIVKGTSLAVPVISGGEVEDSKVTIQWFMENARSVDGKSNYEDELRFDVYCQKKSGGEPITKTFTATQLNSEYKHTFENLAGTSNYQFWIEAYTTKDQSVEKSPVVDITTLTLYTPLAPEFFATKGESAKGVRLCITLPEMVMVNTETNDSLNEKVDEPYPLYFKIYRKAEEGADEDYKEVCENLYYNGSTTPPETSYYTSNPYKAGDSIEWFDDSADLTGGQKYTYKVRAFVDANYSKVVCPVGKEYQDQGVGTSETQAKTDTGWKSATPNFNVKEVNKKYSDDESEVLAVEFAFSASWQDLGKAGDYKFAIKQHREPWDASSPGSDGDKDEWLKTNTDKDFFDTLDEVMSHTVKFGESGRLNAEEEGIYTYTLYIVRQKNGNNDVTISEVESDGENVVLDSVDAKDKALVTHEVNIPNPELTVKDGYTDHVHLIISGLKKEDKDATYTLIRTLIVDGRPGGVKEIPLEIPESAFSSGSSYEYDDKELPGNHRYSYVLKAAAESGAYSQTDSQDAETLGTPEVAFEMGKLAYDSVTISFNGVLAANKYVVELGASERFGNGETFTITKDTSASASGDSNDKEGTESQDEKWSCDTDPKSGAVAKVVSFAANRFTVTIEKPYGYDDARLAGLSANAVVTAHSNVDSAPSEAVSVNVVGPALVNARVGSSADAKEDSIWVAWDAVEGAKGYLIKRVMYDDVNMNEVSDASDATYYYDVSSDSLVLAEGGTLGNRATVAQEGNGFKLTDNYMESDDNGDVDSAEYQDAQSKIPWGLPFRYVVLPVLDKGDFKFGEKSLALASGGKVAYENFPEKQTEGTATFGYGLNLMAEKAMSGNTQRLKWEKPNKLESVQKAVYRRKYTKVEADRRNNFELVNIQSNDVDATIFVADEELCDAFEYVVKYYKNAVTPMPNIELPNSLLKELARQTEEPKSTPVGEITEQKNKGYLLSIDFNAITHPNTTSEQKYKYAEQISWTPWDYAIRAVGPEVMLLTIRNNNIDIGDHDVFSINIDKKTGIQDVELKTIDEDTDVEQYTATIFNVTSKKLVAGDSRATGMLKVLRDARHYYTLTLKQGVYEASREKYSYRQITNEELVRAATLAMAYGIQQTGTNWQVSLNGTTNSFYESYPGSGSAISYRKGGTTLIVKLTHTFTFASFSSAMPTLAGEKATFLTISGTMTGTTGDGGAEGQKYAPRTYTDGSFTVTAAEDGIDLYNATIQISSLSANGSSGITVKYLDDNGATSFGDITPFTFGNGNNKYSKNPLNDGDSEWQ